MKRERLKVIVVILIASVIFSTGCRPETQVPSNKAARERTVSNELVKINHYMAKRNQEQIENFVRRTGWDMAKTGTGLWYMITKKGTGRAVETGDIVVLSYKAFLLDGELVAEASPAEPLAFKVGHGGVESGLEEGVKYLHVGDKARLILPPHLAHGNFGDQEKIPPGAVLLYEIKVLSVK